MDDLGVCPVPMTRDQDRWRGTVALPAQPAPMASAQNESAGGRGHWQCRTRDVEGKRPDVGQAGVGRSSGHRELLWDPGASGLERPGASRLLLALVMVGVMAGFLVVSLLEPVTQGSRTQLPSRPPKPPTPQQKRQEAAQFARLNLRSLEQTATTLASKAADLAAALQAGPAAADPNAGGRTYVEVVAAAGDVAQIGSTVDLHQILSPIAIDYAQEVSPTRYEVGNPWGKACLHVSATMGGPSSVRPGGC